MKLKSHPMAMPRRRRNGPDQHVEIELPYRPPYDWQSIIQFYQAHSITGIERVTDDYFERVIRLDGKIGFIHVQSIAGASRLKVQIAPNDRNVVTEATKRIIKMFDLACDPILVAQRFMHVPLLAKLSTRFPGLRLARGWDPFETAVCSILGQFVSAAQRSSLIGQLVRSCGDEIRDHFSGEKTRCFPDPEVLASANLTAIKTTRARREAIRNLSRRVLSGTISFDDTRDPAAFRKALLDIKGIGAWTAEYISLRAIGDTDAFPATDLILNRALALHPDLDLNAIKPWRSYAAIYLWKAFAQTLSKRSKEKTDEFIL